MIIAPANRESLIFASIKSALEQIDETTPVVNRESLIFNSIKAALEQIDEATPVVNRESLILANVRKWLEQIKLANKPNRRMAFDHPETDCLGLDTLTLAQLEALLSTGLESLAASDVPSVFVYFYTDSDRTNLLFSDNTASASGSFSYEGRRTYYSPPDAQINSASGISTTKSQRLYYVTGVFCDGQEKLVTYRNLDNMLFQRVIFSTKKNPEFTTSENTCIVVPGESRVDDLGLSDDLAHVIVPFDLYVQLQVFDWEHLSEENRIAEGNKAADLIRNALLADRYRDGNCTIRDRNLNGTQIGTWQPLPSKDVLRGVLHCQCVYYASSSSY